jgi:hypothetical protein
MFGKKKPTKVEPQIGEDSAITTPAPIDGALGGKSRVKASKGKLIWTTVVVIAVVLAIANKVIQHREAESGTATPSAPSGALPMGVNSGAKPASTAQTKLPPVPANGALPGVSPTNAIQTVTPTPAAANNNMAVVQLINAASNNTATVVQTFPGPGGLTGVIYRDMNQDKGVAWVDPAKGLVLIGTLIGSDGKDYNTTADFSLAANEVGSGSATAATVSASSASGVEALMNQGTGFVEGTAGPLITVYLDPNSLTSNRLFTALQGAVAQGKVRVRYVLVAVKDKGSMKKAEEILAAPSPTKELSMDERLGKKRATGLWSGGIPGIQGSLAMAQQVDANTALLAAAGYIGDPVVVWCNKTGQAQVATNDGAVGDLSAILSNVGNCS